MATTFYRPAEAQQPQPQPSQHGTFTAAPTTAGTAYFSQAAASGATTAAYPQMHLAPFPSGAMPPSATQAGLYYQQQPTAQPTLQFLPAAQPGAAPTAQPLYTMMPPQSPLQGFAPVQYYQATAPPAAAPPTAVAMAPPQLPSQMQQQQHAMRPQLRSPASPGDLPGSPPGGTSTRVCRHFLQDRCTWGAMCRFSHNATPGMRAAYAQNQMQQGMPQRSAALGVLASSSAGVRPAPVQYIADGAADAVRRQRGEQQRALQERRFDILVAAINATFTIRAAENQPPPAVDGSSETKGLVSMLSRELANTPEIEIRVLSETALRAALATLECDPRVQESGVLYVVGESDIFWSMARQFHVAGTTTSPRWDAAFHSLSAKQSRAMVPCMFHRTPAGCVSEGCPFQH